MDKDEIHLRRLPAAAPWGPRKSRAAGKVRGRCGDEGGLGGCAPCRLGNRLRGRPLASAPRPERPDKGFIISISSPIFKNPGIISAK